MKKIILIMAILAAAAFADVKLDFIISVNKMGCSLKEWVENDYAHGQKWKYFGQFACAEEIHTPPRLVGPMQRKDLRRFRLTGIQIPFSCTGKPMYPL